MRRMYKEKEVVKRAPEETEETQAVPQDTPAADSTDAMLAEVDEVLAETVTHEQAETAMNDIRNRRYSMDLTVDEAKAEVEAWEQKYAHLGFTVRWCCGVPYAERTGG